MFENKLLIINIHQHNRIYLLQLHTDVFINLNSVNLVGSFNLKITK